MFIFCVLDSYFYVYHVTVYYVYEYLKEKKIWYSRKITFMVNIISIIKYLYL